MTSIVNPFATQLTTPVPPKAFVDGLHLFDPFLDVSWSRSQTCWSIWRTDAHTNRREHVMNVVEPDGSYRQLDDRTMQILRMNRYYAEHPDLVIEQIVDKPIQEARRALASERDNLRHLSKDGSLRRQFEKARELAGQVDWKKWGVGQKGKLDDTIARDKVERTIDDQEKERREREHYEAV